MKLFLQIISLLLVSYSCLAQSPGRPNKSFAAMLDKYYSDRMKMLPMESTSNGQPGNNDKLYAEFTDSYRSKLKAFFTDYKARASKFKRSSLNRDEQLSYDIFMDEMNLSLDGIKLGFFSNSNLYPEFRYHPFNQFGGIPLWMGQLGSGSGAQPFRTVKDYNDWFRRASAFKGWADSAIIYFRKGIKARIVLPEALVVKMIPQMEAMVVTDATKSLFYGPVNNLPASFSENDKKKITDSYSVLILHTLVPAYKKLGEFLKNEYLPVARKTTGIYAQPGGQESYKWLIRYWTTTSNSPAEIYNTGLSEVKRIRGLMDSVRQMVGFTGDLKAFFTYMKTDKQFMPFKTAEEILNAYRSIETRIAPNLEKMFNNVPKTRFEIRQTEAFRAASASAEYNAGLPDGSRPGIFYVPIIDPTQFNVTTGMEGLFLHEAIPGHHYQISLQNENEKLPAFRRFYQPGAYVEGWGLYAESLGKELGVYTDPYQYMGALVKEMHRTIRLVVDAGMHSKNMTREEAIAYLQENMPLSERATISEIERYMAIPAQALSYKTGSIKIQQLRRKYEKQLGIKFNLASFHDQLLGNGALPLHLLESTMDEWAKKSKL